MKKVLLLNILITIFLIISLEFITRALKLSNLMGIESGLIYQKENNHFMVPNSSGLIFNAKVLIDSNGYRVPIKNFNYKNKENIIFIGDSVTFGNGVIEENTFVGKLRTNFPTLNFINTSVPGHQIKNYEKKIDNFKKFQNVKKIIYVITLNDVYTSSNLSNLDLEKKAEKERSKNFWVKLRKINLIDKINFFLRNKSYLYMYLKGKFSDPSKRYYKNIDNFYKENEIKSLSDLVTELKKINNNLYIIVLPYEYQTRTCDNNVLLPQKKIKEILKGNKINYFDFTKEFCKSKNKKDYFIKFDPMHLSVLGHDLVYELIKNNIKFNEN